MGLHESLDKQSLCGMLLFFSILRSRGIFLVGDLLGLHLTGRFVKFMRIRIVVAKARATATQGLLSFATIDVAFTATAMTRRGEPFVLPGIVVTVVIVLGRVVSKGAPTKSSFGALRRFAFVWMSLAAHAVAILIIRRLLLRLGRCLGIVDVASFRVREPTFRTTTFATITTHLLVTNFR